MTDPSNMTEAKIATLKMNEKKLFLEVYVIYAGFEYGKSLFSNWSWSWYWWNSS